MPGQANRSRAKIAWDHDMTTANSLPRYRARRKFGTTTEPAGALQRRKSGALRFVVQKHDARQLHYDFRLEFYGVLKSWAVPKEPSLDPAVKRMAVQIEDHPLEYVDFEGEFPRGQYGSGGVIAWDRGEWIPDGDAGAGLRRGKLEFELRGKKLAGRWALIRMRPRAQERQPAWLLIKERDAQARDEDEFSVVAALPESVKPARTREAPRQDANGATAIVLPKGLRITHPERVVDASTGITKAELMRYYVDAAAHLLPQLRARPVALVRGPDGIDGTLFFQKHARELRIPGIKRLDPKLDPGHPALLEIANTEALLGAIQMNVLEFHTWNACARGIEKPDRLVFDIDPGEGVAWRSVQEAVETVRGLMRELELEAFLKTSGGKGLHVIVPVQPRFGWETVRALAQAVMQHLVRIAPDRFVAKSGPKNRVGRIYIDYLRNGRGATTAAAWSTRARPGLGVSVPVAWDELNSLRSGAHWTVRNVAERLDTADPWTGYARARRSLRVALNALSVEVPRERSH
jgi:DNA ligase D-like protein (predicted polymerase)/DNA ligase D-like protein (predicted 3'-phosphoesterase)